MEEITDWEPPRAPYQDESRALNIMDLPDELLCLIVGHAGNKESTGTLASLAQVNRRFNRLVVDQLYTDIKLRLGPQCQSPYLFLRTLMSDQQLAKTVTSLEFGDSKSANRLIPDRHLRSDKHALEVERQLFTNSFLALDIPNWMLWSRFCSTNQFAQILTAAALMYLPNIKSLGVIDGKSKFLNFNWFLILHKSATSDFGNVHTFAHLRNITLRFSKRTPEEVFALLTIPSLRRLTLAGFHQSSAFNPAEVTGYRCSLVEELRIHDTNLRPHVVRRMIAMCKSLKVFECEHPFPHGAITSEPPFLLLWDALCDHKDLERITLLGQEMVASVPSPIFSVRNMQDFRRLMHFEANLRAFFGSFDGEPTLLRLLPGGLREMTVFAPMEHREHDFAQAARLLDRLDRGTFPALRTLRFELHPHLLTRDECFRAEYGNDVGHRLLVEPARHLQVREYNPDGNLKTRDDGLTRYWVNHTKAALPPPLIHGRDPGFSNEEAEMLDDDKFDDVFRKLKVTPDRERLRRFLRVLLKFWG